MPRRSNFSDFVLPLQSAAGGHVLKLHLIGLKQTHLTGRNKNGIVISSCGGFPSDDFALLVWGAILERK